MGFLESFERSLERAVGVAFAKTFRSGIHPLEIVAALKREMDSRATIVSRERTLVPHEYIVRLSPEDQERLSQLGVELLGEIVAALDSHRIEQGYQVADPLRVALEVDTSLTEGMVSAASIIPKDGVVWIPVVEVDGRRFPLVQRRTVIGRGSVADIPLNARGVSRRHCEIIWDGKRAELVDLGSTNGTLVNGERITRIALPERCTITVGQARIVVGVVPQHQARYLSLVESGLGQSTEESP
jgi:hypothetical protein